MMADGTLVYELNATALAKSLKRPARRLAGSGVSANVWYLGVTSLLTDISSESVASILPVYLVLSLHVTPMAFGMVDGVYQGAAALLRPAGGYLADRARAYKPIAMLGYVISAIARLGLLVAGTAWRPIAGFVLADRFGKGIRTAPRDALIAMSAAPERLGVAFGVHRALDSVGAMLGPIVAFALLAWLPGHYNIVFLASFWIAVIGIAVLVLFVDGSGARRETAPSAAPTVRAGLALFADSEFRGVFIAACVLAVGTISDAFVYLIAQSDARISPAMFPLFYVATPFCYFVFAGPFGAIADRVGRGRVFLAGHAPLLLLYAILLFPTASAVTPFAAVILLGMYYAATDGVLAAAASATLPVPLRGTGLAFVATGANAGRLLASLAFGTIWAWWGKDVALRGFLVALCTGVILAIVCLRKPGARK